MGADQLSDSSTMLMTEGIPLLVSLSEAEQNYILPHLRRRFFRRGDTVMARGAFSDGLYLISSGLVGVSLDGSPERGHDVATLGRGECVGEMSLISGEPCSATIHALVDTEMLVIDRADFADVVAECPTLWRNLSNILSRRLVRTNQRLNDERRARFCAVLMLAERGVGSALAAALGALLAEQSMQKVIVLDVGGGGALLDIAGGNSPAGGAVSESPRLRHADIEGVPRARTLRLAEWKLTSDDALAAGEEIQLVEELSSAYDHVILVSDGRDSPGARRWLARASASLIVSPLALSARAKELGRQYANGTHRVDIALMTDLAVTSDNEVGGLWEPSVNDVAEAFTHGAAEEGIRWRLLPRDQGLLASIRARGLIALANESSDPFFRSVSRLARRLGRMEVGLALGAGMAKGFSHIGVLQALKQAGVPVDYLAGSSIGSIVGSTYAGGMALENLQGLMTGADKKFVKLTLPIHSISSNRGLRKILTTCHERAPTARFPELFLPFAAIATDITRGEEVVLSNGLVWSSVLASISMPGIFPPVQSDGRVLADGGLVNPVPATTVRDMGADIVVAVDLAYNAKSNRAAEEGRGHVPNIIDMLWRTMEIMLGEITSLSAANADIMIRPNTGHSQIRDFSRRGAEFIAAGQQAAMEALPEMAALLPFLKAA